MPSSGKVEEDRIQEALHGHYWVMINILQNLGIKK